MIADWLEIDLDPETQPGFYCGYRRPERCLPLPRVEAGRGTVDAWPIPGDQGPQLNGL